MFPQKRKIRKKTQKSFWKWEKSETSETEGNASLPLGGWTPLPNRVPNGCKIDYSLSCYRLLLIVNWFNTNFLLLNPNKSNCIVFTGPRNKQPEDPNKSIILNNVAIKRVSNVKFLDVIIDEHLTWKSHINLVKSKAAKMIGIIKRLKFTLPLSALRILYNAFVLPGLNYGLILWGRL